MSLGLVYETSLEDMKKAVSLVEELLESYKEKETLKSYRVHFDMFGDFSLNILVTYFSRTSDFTEFVKEKE
jgi:small-conductance mechanosensitive channel